MHPHTGRLRGQPSSQAGGDGKFRVDRRQKTADQERGSVGTDLLPGTCPSGTTRNHRKI